MYVINVNPSRTTSKFQHKDNSLAKKYLIVLNALQMTDCNSCAVFLIHLSGIHLSILLSVSGFSISYISKLKVQQSVVNVAEIKVWKAVFQSGVYVYLLTVLPLLSFSASTKSMHTLCAVIQQCQMCTAHALEGVGFVLKDEVFATRLLMLFSRALTFIRAV